MNVHELLKLLSTVPDPENTEVSFLNDIQVPVGAVDFKEGVVLLLAKEKKVTQRSTEQLWIPWLDPHKVYKL